MKINKKELIKALTTVKPGLASKEMIEQSTSFCFLDNTVVTYNDEISISCPVPGIELKGAVNAVELYAFVNKVKTEEIDLSINENEILLKAGRSKAGLTLTAEVVLPIEEIGKINKWKKLPDKFLDGLAFASAACSRDMSRPVLTCVHINKDVIEGTDSFRAARYFLKESVPIKPTLLPAHICLKVARMKPL